MATATQSPPQIVRIERDANQNNEAARQLLRKWRDEATHDEAAHDDETTWLDVQALIEENRLSVRRKFGE